MSALRGLLIVRPENESKEVAALAAAARAAAEDANLPLLKSYRAQRRQVVGEKWQRPVEFLTPSDARGLYRAVHQNLLLVVAFTAIYVRRDPSRDPVERRAALKLATFVEHKAAFRMIRSRHEIAPLVSDFGASGLEFGCDGEDDPRCLPLHVFSVDQAWPGLRDQPAREEFARRYGPARFRLDEAGKRWARAQRGAYHGGESLVVAGRELPRGMHWDVTSERGNARLLTSDEIWKIPSGGRGYVNVFPDAYVRNGRRARRVWP